MNYAQYGQNMYQMPSPPIVNYTPGSNFILCELYVYKDDRNKKQRIISSYEEHCRNFGFEMVEDLKNEEQIKNCTIYIDGKQIPFAYTYSFAKSGTHKVKFVFNFPLTNCSYMFYRSDYKTMDLSNFDTSYVTDMSFMFYNCSCTEKFNLSNFNTQNVHDMSYMFYDCSGTYELNLTSFNTQNVVNMTKMFANCTKLIRLYISSFNTINVKYMNHMFYNDFTLNELDLSSFNTQNVLDMNGMFKKCSFIKSINLLNFSTKSVINLDDMFKDCKAFDDKNIITNDPGILTLLGKYY